jgi:hypothetical protein
MKLDAATDAIAITIESSGEPLSTVRLERAESAFARVSIRFEHGAIVVTCGPGMILEAPSEPKRRLLPPVESLATIGDADWYPATPTATRVGVPIECELLPPEEAVRPKPPAAPQALDPGDAPTRIAYHPPSERAVASSSPPAAPPVPPATKGPRIRRSVRRFALLAMLAVSWMLWFHAYRSRRAHASHTVAAGGASPSSAPSSRGALASGSAAAGKRGPEEPLPAGAAAVPPSPSPSVASLASAPSFAPRPSNGTEARSAADALANGDYASAVKLYDDLASKFANNPAYAEVARSLRARSAPLAP